MINKTADTLMFFAACLVVAAVCVVVTLSMNESFAADQSKLEVKTVYRIVYFECGKYKFRVGDNGVVEIGHAQLPSGEIVFVATYKDGGRTTTIPKETYIIKEEQQNIVIPNIVMADGTNKAQ